MTQVFLAFCRPLVLVSFHEVVLPHGGVAYRHSSCQSAYFLPYNVLCALRFWAPLSLHKTAEQDAYTPYPNFLRGLYWKLVWVIFLSANIPLDGAGEYICWRGIPPHLTCFVLCHPSLLKGSGRCASFLTTGLQASSLNSELNCGLSPSMDTGKRPLSGPTHSQVHSYLQEE